jgi:hypothetical protein
MKHWHKAFLGLSLVVSAALIRPAVSAYSVGDEGYRTLKVELERQHAEHAPPPIEPTRIRWSEPVLDFGADDWVASYRTRLDARLVKPPRPPEIVWVTSPATLAPLQAGVDRVGLSWKIEAPVVDGVIRRLDPIRKVVVERLLGETWAPVYESEQASAWEDVGLEPDRSYVYRLRVLTERGESVSPSREARTLDRWKLELKWILTRDRPVGRVHISKFEAGRWIRTVDPIDVYEDGDLRIGGKLEGDAWNYRHEARETESGKRVTAEFNTGFRVVSVDARRVVYIDVRGRGRTLSPR